MFAKMRWRRLELELFGDGKEEKRSMRERVREGSRSLSVGSGKLKEEKEDLCELK